MPFARAVVDIVAEDAVRPGQREPGSLLQLG